MNEKSKEEPLELEKIVHHKNANRMIKMSNDVNNQDLFQSVDEFTETENNIFYACIAQVYGENTNIVKFSSSQMKALIGYNKHISMSKFVEKLDRALTKFLKIVIKYRYTDRQTGHKVLRNGNLFRVSEVDTTTLDCVIQVNPEFKTLFNQMERWTRFSLLQYTSLKGNYTKKLYRLLKQYRTSGIRQFGMEDFRQLLNIPKSYRTSHIRERVLNKSLEELSPYFSNLKIEDIYNKRKIIGYKFTWIPEANYKKDFNSDLLDESIAIMNIRNNKNMTQDQKFRAYDYYRKLKLGTTKDIYKHGHPNTVFIGDKDKSKVFIRAHLKQASKYSITQLKELVKFYEKLNTQGVLHEGDLKDLQELEALLWKKERKLALQTKNNDNPYRPSGKDTIAEEVLVDLTGLNNVHYEEPPKKYIDAKVASKWATEKKNEDHRRLEFKEGIEADLDEVEFDPNFPYNPVIPPEAFEKNENKKDE